MSPTPVYHVWNVTLGYAEHIGSRLSCETWVRNVRDSGFASDTYEVRPGRSSRRL